MKNMKYKNKLVISPSLGSQSYCVVYCIYLLNYVFIKILDFEAGPDSDPSTGY